MDKDKIPVIAINREYGAGGRALAAVLSERLDIPYYDKDFVTKTVKESGYDKEEVEREGEEISEVARVFDSFLGSSVSYSSSHDAIFEAEKKVILDLAKEPCIMVGRCADQILKKAGVDVLSVYLHAPHDMKLERAKQLKEYGDEKPEKFMEKRDKQRAIFYKQYTGGDISDAANYTLTFDVGKVSVERIADMITGILNKGD